MARYPKIDSPCPLSIAEQREINGECKRCNKHVHALDSMSDDERKVLMASSSGAVCVSYRLPVRARAGLGLAMATTLAASSVMAGEVPAVAPPASDEGSEKLEVIIMVGGVEDPVNATWVDDSDLPELPMVVEERSASGASEALPLRDPKPSR
jgi:hypothetical protein